jgi:two-component system sensor histidine kinase BarA
MSDPQADSKSTPIDHAALAEIACGDEAAERRLLVVFRAANDADVAVLEAAVERRDAPAVTRAAHRLVGAARLAGAGVLADVCSRIVQAGRAGDWDAIESNRDALHGELARINLYLDARLNVHAGAGENTRP